MKYIALISISLSLISCHPNLAKERKKNAPYLVEADRIVLGCEKYYARHGKYPEKLDDLGTLFWSHAKMDIRKDYRIEINYNNKYTGVTGLEIQIGAIQYDYDFVDWEKGWQESDQSF